MNTRTIKLCIKLLNVKHNLSLFQLAEYFNVSERTIRNDIDLLNHYLRMKSLNTVQINGGLVSLAIENKRKIYEHLDNMSFYEYRLDQAERQVVIMLVLLLSDNSITIDELSSFLSVSRTTIIKDLEEVLSNDLYAKHVISVHSVGLKIVGLTPQKKINFFIELLNSEGDLIYRFFNQELVEKIINVPTFTLCEMKKTVQRIVLETQEETHQFLTTQSNLFLTHYLLFTVINSYSNDAKVNKIKRRKKKLYQFEQKLVTKATSEFCNKNCSHIEYYSVFNHLKFISSISLSKNIVQTQMVTRKFIENVSNSLGVDLNKDYILFENLANHISLVLDNPITSDKYSDQLFEIIKDFNQNHVDIKKTINENIYILNAHANRTFNELETSYILIYIAAALERKKNAINELKVLIVCNSGVGTSQLIRNRIKQTFNLMYCEVVTSYLYKEFLKLNSVDLIISTVEMEFEEVPFIVVSPMLINVELVEIAQTMDIIKFKKLKEGRILIEDESRNILKIKKYLRSTLFNQEELLMLLEKTIDEYMINNDVEFDETIRLSDILISKNIKLHVEATSWIEAVEKGAEILLQNDSIDRKYTTEIIKNFKEFGPYSVIAPGFLVSHAGFKIGTHRLDMSLIRLKNPIEFMDSPLNPIEFIYTFSPIDGRLHLNALFTLVNAIQNEETYFKIKQAKSAKEIYTTLLAYEREVKIN